MTKQPDVRRHRDGISIHTSAREVTKKTMTMMMRQKNFNPHFRKGSDKEELRLFLFCKEISIHTSAREVTALRKMYGSNCVWFQSTLPQGKWQYGKSKNRRALWFQSTLPQGKWLYNITDRTKMELFQSTLPQGKWRGEMDYSQFRAYFNPHFRKGSD